MTEFYNTHDFKKKQIDFIQVEPRKILMEKNQWLEIESLMEYSVFRILKKSP